MWGFLLRVVWNLCYGLSAVTSLLAPLERWAASRLRAGRQASSARFLPVAESDSLKPVADPRVTRGMWRSPGWTLERIARDFGAEKIVVHSYETDAQ